MNKTTWWIISSLMVLAVATIFNIYPLVSQGKEDNAQTAEEFNQQKLELERKLKKCDLKKRKRTRKCLRCKKLLIGYKCQTCQREVMAELNEESDEEDIREAKKNYLFLAEKVSFKKCSNCEKKFTGPMVNLVADRKCVFCGGGTHQISVCVKELYACSDHAEYESLNRDETCQQEITNDQGETQACGKQFVLKRVNLAEVLIRYRCPRCQGWSDRRGTCCECNQSLNREKYCEKAGVFPHVDEVARKKLKELLEAKGEKPTSKGKEAK